MAGSLSRYERTRCYRLGWAFERIGWVLMAVVVCGGAAGVFGDGALSSVEVTAGDALAVRHPRFARAHAPLELDVEWTPQRHDGALWLARRYLDEFEIEEVRPTPAAVTLDRERIYHSFRLGQVTGRVRVVFRLRPEHGGRIVGALGVDSEAEVELRHLIFP